MKAFVYKFLGTIVDDFFAYVKPPFVTKSQTEDGGSADSALRCQLSIDWRVSAMMWCSSFSCINDGSIGSTPSASMRCVRLLFTIDHTQQNYARSSGKSWSRMMQVKRLYRRRKTSKQLLLFSVYSGKTVTYCNASKMLRFLIMERLLDFLSPPHHRRSDSQSCWLPKLQTCQANNGGCRYACVD